MMTTTPTPTTGSRGHQDSDSSIKLIDMGSRLCNLNALIYEYWVNEYTTVERTTTGKSFVAQNIPCCSSDANDSMCSKLTHYSDINLSVETIEYNLIPIFLSNVPVHLRLDLIDILWELLWFGSLISTSCDTCHVRRTMCGHKALSSILLASLTKSSSLQHLPEQPSFFLRVLSTKWTRKHTAASVPSM